MIAYRGFKLPILPLTLALALIVSVVGVAVSKDYAFENKPPRTKQRSKNPIDKRSSCYFTYLNLPVKESFTSSLVAGVVEVYQKRDHTIHVDFSIGAKFKYKPKYAEDLMSVAVQTSYDSNWTDSVYVLYIVRQDKNANGGSGYLDLFFIFPDKNEILYAFDVEKSGYRRYGFDNYCIDRFKKEVTIPWLNSDGVPNVISKVKLKAILVNSGKRKSQKGKRNFNGFLGAKF